MKEKLIKKATELGLTHNAYMRFLVAKDLSSPKESVNLLFFESFDEVYNKIRKIVLIRSFRKHIKPRQ